MPQVSRVYWESLHDVAKCPAPNDAVEQNVDILGQALLSAVVSYVNQTRNGEFAFRLWNVLQELPDVVAYHLEQDQLLFGELDSDFVASMLDKAKRDAPRLRLLDGGNSSRHGHGGSSVVDPESIQEAS